MKRLILTIALALTAAAAIGQTRIKDIASVAGARRNQLIGYGLVVGLEGTGDGNSATFTPQTLSNMLQKFEINVPAAAIKTKNVAAVVVTADLPAFVKNGSQIDVTVSSIGDAKSLQGGTLLQTPLKGGPNNHTYAIAQGPISIGGFNFSAGGSSMQKNHVAVGRIPGGALVEEEVPTSLTDGKTLSITLAEADFTTANRVAEAINLAEPRAHAVPVDALSVQVSIPDNEKDNLVGFISRIERLPVTPDTTARIVVNERTGSIVIGGDVRVFPCAIASGGIQVKVENTPVVAVPAPFTDNGKPVIAPFKNVSVKETNARLASVPATTSLDQLVRALNALGVSPRDLISILQLMRSGGYIMAEVEIQ